MSSNNRLSNMLPGNVKIKIEPGTSRYSNIITDKVNIKLEPGTSQRLTSLKLPRDLKLGGSKTKIIKPNLNVVRNKKTETPSPNINNRGRGRGRGRGSERGRGSSRGRQANVVQSYGVFSEGISDAMRRRSERFSQRFKDERDYDASKIMDKPTINKNSDWKVDKEQEELIMNDLLSIQIEPDEGEDTVNDLHPIFLPVSKFVDQKPTIKVEQLLKTEEDIKPPSENGINEEKKLFESQEKLFLFQFPDTLPGIGGSVETENQSNAEKNNSEQPQPQVENKCTLHDVNEGLLGKVCVYKSGKTKLIIGNNRFDIELGPEAGFLQDVMSIPINPVTKTGDMITLGSVEGNVIVTPEWASLLRTD